jgi:hypothetical protein
MQLYPKGGEIRVLIIMNLEKYLDRRYFATHTYQKWPGNHLADWPGGKVSHEHRNVTFTCEMDPGN